MNIRHLSIEGFLSYQKKVEIDFTLFDLACITGENGAGKSSILDAITWVLFGRARQSNESLINLQSDEAIVSFSFEYSGESYKVRRSNKRGKSARLTLKTPELDLTERTTRDTQNKIEEILKIDFETFIHAVFFLQGDSDQFVSASSGQRKQVLFDILGLDAWEDFRLKATAEIKTIEKSMEQALGSVQVLEEGIRKGPEITKDLEIVENELTALEKELEDNQINLDAAQKKKDEYTALRDEVADLHKDLAQAKSKKVQTKGRIANLQVEQQNITKIISRKEQINKDYARSKEVDVLLEELNQQRVEHAKLINDLAVVESAQLAIDQKLAKIPELETKIEFWKEQAEEAAGYEASLLEIKESQIKKSAETEGFIARHKVILKQYQGLEGHMVCPLCEQELTDPESLVNKLQKEMTDLEQIIESNKTDNALEAKTVSEIQGALRSLSQPQEKIGPALDKILSIRLEEETFDRGKVDALRIAISNLNYSDEKRVELQNEANLIKDAPRDHGLLEGAEKTGESLDVQIKGLEQDLFDIEATVLEYKNQIEAKDIGDYWIEGDNEITLLTQVRNETKAKLQVKTQRTGELQQQLKSISDQRTKLKEIKANEKENTELHQKYSVLQEAFSKKGVPALLVEQALPQIESKANQLLNRLSDGNMAVHFITQKKYSDSSREDLKEILDIEIQDQAGIRDYEMYSGGESFRINFAIRMALSNVLANRAGAKLRTLIVDEGFGSQDASGRDRLINAINTIKDDFDKVLVISHISEIIESFPTQLKVEKTSSGSTVTML